MRLTRTLTAPTGCMGFPRIFIEFDELTGGLHPGQMIVVAARPGVGKSTLALDIARSAAIHHDMTTVFFSLEMGRTELAMRVLSAEGRISMGRLKKGDLDQEGWTNLATCRENNVHRFLLMIRRT